LPANNRFTVRGPKLLRRSYGSMGPDRMIRPVRIFEKAVLQSSHSPQERNGEEWLDREIASLRESVEPDAEGQTSNNRTYARSPARRLLRFGATRAAAGHRALRLPMHHGGPLRRLRRAVGRRRFEIATYGISIALAVAAGWLIGMLYS
jgi:hypothetical protein